MKYKDDVAKSAEYMRSAIPLMAKQNAGFDPISYTVWYEFVAGINSGLTVAIEDLLRRGETIDEQTIFALFNRYIAELDTQTAQRISQRYQQILQVVSSSTAVVQTKTAQYGQSLASWREEMDGTLAPQISSEVAKILVATDDMQSVVETLNERLANSQREIDTLRQEMVRSRSESMNDNLTGLLNRRGFELMLSQQQNSQHQPLSLLMLDLDNFAALNAQYGHLFGDKVIVAIANLLKQNIKGKDIIARYGGEEFTILLPNTNLHGALHLAENIRNVVERSRIKRNQDNIVVSHITVSIGVVYHHPDEPSNQFVKRAEQAMLHAKHQGRNRVVAETSHT